jgi:hypothetical protein
VNLVKVCGHHPSRVLSGVLSSARIRQRLNRFPLHILPVSLFILGKLIGMTTARHYLLYGLFGTFRGTMSYITLLNLLLFCKARSPTCSRKIFAFTGSSMSIISRLRICNNQRRFTLEPQDVQSVPGMTKPSHARYSLYRDHPNFPSSMVICFSFRLKYQWFQCCMIGLRSSYHLHVCGC